MNSKLDRDSDDIGGLAGLPGLQAVRDQLAARIAVLQAELALYVLPYASR